LAKKKGRAINYKTIGGQAGERRKEEKGDHFVEKKDARRQFHQAKKIKKAEWETGTQPR